jgi:hypothetical protein
MNTPRVFVLYINTCTLLFLEAGTTDNTYMYADTYM